MPKEWHTCPAVCFAWPTSRRQLLEQDTVFAWVARERSIYVIYEMCQSLYMQVQANLGHTPMHYFPFRLMHTLAVFFRIHDEKAFYS